MSPTIAVGRVLVAGRTWGGGRRCSAGGRFETASDPGDPQTSALDVARAMMDDVSQLS
jgi:hypothetical protein